MKRGDNVRLINGKCKGIVILSPSEVDCTTMCMVSWFDEVFKNTPSYYRYSWERVEDLVLC